MFLPPGFDIKRSPDDVNAMPETYFVIAEPSAQPWAGSVANAGVAATTLVKRTMEARTVVLALENARMSGD
jgi:hypothetical protein